MENKTLAVTPRQSSAILNSTNRINLWYGSVRSGKTIASLVWWCAFVKSRGENEQFLMVGRTITTLKRNILFKLQELEPSFKFSVVNKSATLYGRQIWLEGADNSTSESKIRGMTLSGVYMDELTLIHEHFYQGALSRLSVKNAKLIATTNPDDPNSYVYRDIVLNEKIDKNVEKFHLLDNDFLDREYIEQIQIEYTGVYKKRYIDGDFVKAEGLVFFDFAENVSAHIVKRENVNITDKRCYVGLDIGGNKSAYAMTAVVRGLDGVYTVLKSSKRQASNLNMSDVEKFVEGFCQCVENEYGVMIFNINSDHNNVIVNSINDNTKYMAGLTYKPKLEERPIVFNKLLNTKRLKFVENQCDDLIDELTNIVFDDKANRAIVLDNGSMQIDTFDSLTYSMTDDWHYI